MCIDIMLTPAKDGSQLSVRTLEFGSDLDPGGLIRCPGTHMVSPGPGGGTGLSWTVKYGYVGFEAFRSMIKRISEIHFFDGFQDLLFTFDGMNTEGLTCGSLWFDKAVYQQNAGANDKALLWLYFCDWVLGTCATVEDVRGALQGGAVWVWGPQAIVSQAPFHFPIHDKSGHSIVVEFIDGKVFVRDNPSGVCANAPELPWHLTNIRNYAELTPETKKSVSYPGVTFKNWWSGQGMNALPGGYTSPSRFIRGFMLKSFATQVSDSGSLRTLGVHLLDTLDIIKGTATCPKEGGGTDVDCCYVISMRDPTNLKYYIRTYDNPQLLQVDLRKVDFTASGTRSFDITYADCAIDITGRTRCPQAHAAQ